MKSQHSIPAQDVPAGGVGRAGPWAVGNRDGALFAVSRFCRHQLADLSGGSIDANGCLVCPWHQSAYDVDTGIMVRGPQGFLGLHRRVPGYDRLVLAYARLLRLRVRRAERRGDLVVVDEEG